MEFDYGRHRGYRVVFRHVVNISKERIEEGELLAVIKPEGTFIAEVEGYFDDIKAVDLYAGSDLHCDGTTRPRLKIKDSFVFLDGCSFPTCSEIEAYLTRKFGI